MKPIREILTRPVMALVPTLLALVLGALASNATAGQVTETWTGGVGDWVNETKWSPLVCSVPSGACPPSAFTYPRNGAPDAATTYAIQIDGGNAANSVVTLDVGISIDTLTVGEGDQLTLESGNFLRIDGGTVTNNGTILLNSTGTLTKLSGFGADLTLGGTGTIVMSDRPPGFGNFIKSDSGHRLTNAAGHTIRGPGNFGDTAGPLTNHGLIDADSPSGNTLVVFPNADDMINTGTMQASNGGILRLSGGPDRTFTNTGGLIQALADSVVELGDADIVGGELSTAGTGVTRSLSATLDGVTITGTVEVPNARNLHLKGTVTNNGTIALNGSSPSFASLRYVEDAMLTGTGTVTMSDDLGNQIRTLTAGLRLTHGAGHTIQGAGDIGQNAGPLTNLGTIIANQTTRLEIDVSSAETFTNQGTLQASAGSTLNVIDNFDNAGGIVVGGILKLGSSGLGTVTQVAGGTLSGGGTVQGNLVNGGEVNPGASAGTLTVTRNFTQQGGGVLNIELGGAGAGEFDKLAVTMTATLAGTLNVTLIDGFVPAPGTTFVIMTFDDRSGDFATKNLDLGQGRYATAQYSTNALTLTIAALDHYLCYKVKTTKNTPKFVPPLDPVTLTDQFETVDAEVLKPVSLCAPVDKNGEAKVDADTHLKGYKIKQPKTDRHRGLEIQNQFHPTPNGLLLVDTTTPSRLLVPTAKSLVGSPPEPDPASHQVDHYKCYDVTKPSKFKAMKPITGVELKDQFIEAQLGGLSKLFDLKKPSRLCAPVDKDLEKAKHPATHLMCYRAVRQKEQPQHARVVGIFVNNQFGPEQLDTITEEELCVPSTKIVP